MHLSHFAAAGVEINISRIRAKLMYVFFVSVSSLTAGLPKKEIVELNKVKKKKI